MIAVIIPAYNRPDCLRRALNSLAIQTKKMFIPVVIDDASIEDIQSVCDEFYNSLNIKYIRLDENKGPAGARQVGLDWVISANIELVTFLDSDDMFYPHTIERLTYEIGHNRWDMVVPEIFVEAKYEPGFILDAERNAQTWLHGKVIRVRKLVEENIRFDESLRINEDVNFLVKCNAFIQNKMYLEEALYLWRDEKSSITRNSDGFCDKNLNIGYIEATYKALMDIRERTNDLSKYVGYVFAYYKHCQLAKHNNNLTSKSKELIKKFIALPEIQKQLKLKSTWRNHVQAAISYIVQNKGVIFFKQTFEEWLKEFDEKGEILSEISGG